MNWPRSAYVAIARLLVLLSPVSLPSCYPVKHPLVDPAQAKPDERLFGAWKHVPSDADDGRYEYLFIGGSGDSYEPAGIMKAVSVSNAKDNKKVDAETFYFFQATLGRAVYAHIIDNATASRSGYMQWDRPSSKYYLVKYVVEKDQLTIWLMDFSATMRAITDGQLKGTITERGGGLFKLKMPVITETGQGLSRFLTGGGDKILFPDAGKFVFAKVK